MKHLQFPHLKSFSALTRRRRLTDHGQAMVEFAFMFPILVLILMGTVDLGHGIYAYGVVSSAAREGARYGTTNHEPPDLGSGGNISVVATANTQALDRSRITVNAQKVCPDAPDPCGGGYGTIQVTVTYQFQPLTLFFAPLTMTGQSTMYLE